MRWQAKVLVQFVLAHAPGGEKVNHRLQLAGGRHTPERIRGRIDEAVEFLTSIEPTFTVEGKSIVEVGTGWDGLHPLLLSVLGAERIVTFDHVRHLRGEHAATVIEELSRHPALDELEAMAPGARARCEALRGAADLDDLLSRARIEYVAPGDATDTGLADSSVDVVYDFAVLEHVPETVIEGLLAEARRILRPGGVMVSVIGTGDHYVSVQPSLTQVNFLKYPEWLWKPLVKNKISYHNRLREAQHLELFAAHGAVVEWKHSHLAERDVAAARTMKVDPRFAGLTPEELAIWRSDVIVSFADG